MRNLLLLLLCSISVLLPCKAQDPTASLEQSAIRASETDGIAEVCVVLTEPVSRTASVVVQTAPNSVNAEANVDYVPMVATLTFNVGNETRKCVDFIVLDDNIEEGNRVETFTVQLVPPPEGAGGVIVSFDLVTITIEDSDELLLSFTEPIHTIAEGNSESICVRIVNGSLADGVDLRVEIEPSKSENAGDFNLETPSLLISQDLASPACVTLTIIDDNIIEPQEIFNLTLVEDALSVRFELISTMIMIEDNDGVEVQLEGTEFDILEQDPGMNVNQEVCVRLLNTMGGLERNAVLNIIVNETGTATNLLDYSETNASLIIPKDSEVNSQHCTQIEIIGDDQREDNETILFSFSPANTADMIRGDRDVTVIIIDDNDIQDCRTLVRPANGAVTQNGNSFGSIARYTCILNFILSPAESAIRLCTQEISGWNGTDPTCFARCRPHSVQDGIIFGNVNNATVGTVLTYSCIANFQLVGVSTRTCADDGTWIGDAPICEPLRCDRLQNPLFGSVQFMGDLRVGTVANYGCQRGFVSSGGSITRRCEEDQMWSGEEIICSELATAGPFETTAAGGSVAKSMMAAWSLVLLSLMVSSFL